MARKNTQKQALQTLKLIASSHNSNNMNVGALMKEVSDTSSTDQKLKELAQNIFKVR